MKIKNVFILGGGALQLLNALEAARHFLADSSTAALVLGKPLKEFENIVQFEDWGSVLWIDRVSDVVASRHPARLLELRRHTKYIHGLLDKYRGCERVFLGNYTEFHRHLVAWLEPREVVFIGDGMSDLPASQMRSDALKDDDRPSISRVLRQKLYGWTAEHVPRMTYFSSIPLTLADEDTFVSNSYKSLRERFVFSEEAKREVVAFAGQPLYLRDFGFSGYWTLLQEALATFDGAKEYWCHPKEDYESVQRRLRPEGVVVRKSQQPLELEFLKNGFPANLLSFCSTTLVTCERLFSEFGLVANYVEGDKRQEIKWSAIRRLYLALGIKSIGNCESLALPKDI